MTLSNAYEEMTRLESFRQPFDERYCQQYLGLIRQFIAGMRSLTFPGVTFPFWDVASEKEVTIPPDLLERLDAWCKRRQLSPTLRKICIWHLKQVVLELNAEPVATVYQPLMDLLEIGGDFYVHHGDICIRDAATIVGALSYVS